MAEYSILPVRRLLGFGEADQGERVVIQVEDDRGQDVRVLIPHEISEDFILRFHGAVNMAAEKRTARTGKPHQEVVLPLHIKQFQLGQTTKPGVVLLRCRLKNGMELDFPLNPELRDQMRQLLDRAEEIASRESSPKAN